MHLLFPVSLIFQIALLVGNQVTQGTLAAVYASKEGGQGGRRFWMLLVAFFRGLCGFELLYHKWGKVGLEKAGEEGVRLHIQGALNVKLVQLVFEAPQVVISGQMCL